MDVNKKEKSENSTHIRYFHKFLGHWLCSTYASSSPPFIFFFKHVPPVMYPKTLFQKFITISTKSNKIPNPKSTFTTIFSAHPLHFEARFHLHQGWPTKGRASFISLANLSSNEFWRRSHPRPFCRFQLKQEISLHSHSRLIELETCYETAMIP